MSLELLKAARDAQAALVEAAKQHALDAHRTADAADKVAGDHSEVLTQLDAALTAVSANDAAVHVLLQEVDKVKAAVDALAKAAA